MRDAVGADGVPERRRDVALATHVVEALRAPLARDDLVAQMGAPAAALSGHVRTCAHSRAGNSRIYPALGDVQVSNRRRAMLTLVEDNSPGLHDTLLCACSREIYRELGVEAYHRNCEDNLHEALAALGMAVTETPNPLNLFMNTPVVENGAIDRRAPTSKPGDDLVLRAEMDLVIVFSACPQDITPINGPELTPRDAHFRIEPASESSSAARPWASAAHPAHDGTEGSGGMP